MTTRSGYQLAAGLLVAAGAAFIPQAEGAPGQGLSVSASGQLMLSGRPYRGVGVNYFDAFYRRILNPQDTSYTQGFGDLAAYDVPFIRFSAGAYWPIEWDLYLNNRAQYFTIFDQFVAAAELHQIGLIPSFFWHFATPADIVGEPMDQWGNPESATHQFMRTYTQEVVSRYKDSPAIWGWEFGNEFDLAADLPNAEDHRLPVWPDLGTPAFRSARDDITREMIVTAFSEFAATVRQLDPERIVMTGNSLPRPHAYHNHRFGTWERDTRGQFGEMLLSDNPDPIDVVSVHVYPEAEDEYFAGELVDIAELIAAASDFAAEAGKALFVGEFGSAEGLGPEYDRAKFEEILAAIEQGGVSLAAPWVFDSSGRPMNFTVDNDRTYILTLIQQANLRMVVPEPGTATLLCIAVSTLILYRWKHQRRGRFTKSG